MSKKIKLTEEQIAVLLPEIERSLKKQKMVDGKAKFKVEFESITTEISFSTKKDEEKATIYFNQIAWDKTRALLHTFNDEVGWHGTAERGEEENSYYITDILVYPQEVTGATIVTDQQEYETWLMSHPDEVFNNIRMQGHSHVNMGVTPSGTDLELYNSIITKLRGEMFYIFMIFNKKHDVTVKIYDLKTNRMFDTSEVDVKVSDEGTLDFLDDAKEKVTKANPAAIKATGYTGYNYPNYNGFHGAAEYSYNSNTKTIQPNEKTTKKEEKPSKKNEKKYKLKGALPPLEDIAFFEGLYGSDVKDPFFVKG